jgi:pro-kumamolisin-like protein/List-Bact-rpt repeat protein
MIIPRFLRWKSGSLRKWQRQLRLGITGGLLAAVVLSFASWPAALAQTAGGRPQALITQSVNDGILFRLAGNIPPAAQNAANDRGSTPDTMPMPHMLLQLRRPAAQEQALTTLIDQLHDPSSPNYHQWLSAEQLGAQFGPAASDIQTITNWLGQHGFTVNAVLANRMAIDFSGTAGQVRTALHTDIHYLDVRGVTRFANVNDPQIPAALAAAVVGVTALNNIPPKPMMRRTQKQYSPAGYICGPGFAFPCELVTPSDLATIYNFNPLFAAGTTGQGQTVYLIEDTDLYTNADWTTFRSTFGIPVSSYPGASLTTVNPGNCAHDVNGDDGEAILDAEYASAAAPSVAIVIASCEDLLLAIQRVVNGANPPAIMSISYGNCESGDGATFNQSLYTAYQTGVAAGMSIFVSSGDGGADSCDNHDTATSSTSGISASGFASTPYNVAVGGTDFSDTYNNVTSTYWNSSNSPTYGSALSYIPEIPWNNSCGSELYAAHYGFATTYGPGGLCNSGTASSDGLLNIGAGSGAPSSCATGSGATCQGWPKPSWQTGFIGNPADGVRDLPDVSLFAAAGGWGHFYIFCYSDPNNGGSPCSGAPITWSGAGGTSFASPIWAGIQALVNQYTGSRQGNPNPALYKIAGAEYGAGGSSTCNASNGNTIGSSCIFYDVTLGDMIVDCTSGTPNCYAPGGTYGVLSTSTSSYAPAFKANTGWDFATGIGTVNVYNLITNWASLFVSVIGSGTVASNPAGISCPSTCSHAFTGGSQVTLTPTPTSGWSFSSWGGACSGNGGCTVVINAAESVTATFVQNVALSVSVTGSGTVTSSPAGISCPSTCSENLAPGTQVTLTATPASGSGFEGWSGACSGFDNCVVTMSSAQSVTATFAQTQYTLNVSVAGNGTVTSSPPGVSCPSVCTMNYSSGTPVTLTAAPAGGATFNGWGGACSGNGSCLLTMNSIESVTAMFSASGGGGGPSPQTFVSASLGSDANPCTRQSPCLTFAAALGQTNAGGEIDVLDPGDFGPVTITKAVSIAYGADSVAGTIPNPGTSGIVISAGTNDPINLRGLIFDGVNASGTSGVVFLSGARLYVENCAFLDFTTSGITFSPGAGSANTTQVVVQDTTILNNATGLLIKPTGGIAANAELRQLRIDHNTGEGLRIDGTGGSGAIKATLADSTASSNASNGIDAVSGPGNASVDVMRIVAAANGSAGIASNQSGGGTASVTVGSAVLYANAIGIQAAGGASLLTYGNNQVTGNVSNGSFTGTASLQ